MSINPISVAQNAAAAKKTAVSAPTPAVGFEEMLAKGTPGEEVSPETAAEVLRLQMLSSALSLGGDPDAAPAANRSLNVQGLLNRFLEQIPAGGSHVETAAPASHDPGVEGAYEAMQADFAAGTFPPVVGAGVAADSGTDAIIEKASRRYGVDSGLIRAVIKAESNFNPRAVSSAGAQGLMQLMPATARGLGVSDSFDPEQNVMAGTRFLKDLLRRYDGNIDEALAAYNWGPGRVDKHGTSHLPRETRDYLVKVKGYFTQGVEAG